MKAVAFTRPWLRVIPLKGPDPSQTSKRQFKFQARSLHNVQDNNAKTSTGNNL